MTSELCVDGLDATVAIHRDGLGIPHCRAATEHDAFFAQGFVQAEDRLGQLEYDRRRAYGRWAEIAGPAAVPFDVFARRCGIERAAQTEYASLSASAQAVLDAYAAGVNASLARGLPPPPDVQRFGTDIAPWKPWDCCAVFLVQHVVFANWQLKLWRGRVAAALGVDAVARLWDVDIRDCPVIVPPGALFQPRPHDPAGLDTVADAMRWVNESAGASNAWVLAGDRTASGRPLVAGDPHRAFGVPNVYYQCHLACDAFDAIGLAFVGVPGVAHFGHNQHIAWCVTNAFGDYQDLYVERFRDDGAEYEHAGSWQRAHRRTEIIAARGAGPRETEVFETQHHGPVVFGNPVEGYGIAMRSTALDHPSTGLSVIAPMLRATNVAELFEVMRGWVDPVNNLVAADTNGTIAYHTVGHIPVRSRATAWGPVPGWTAEHEWHGLVPYDELPQVTNPPHGAIVTANQRITNDEYPHYLGQDVSRPDRASRIWARLDELVDATVADVAAVHRDRRSLGADLWVERLLALAPQDDYERAALELLAAWDRNVDVDSAGAAVYVVVRDAVTRFVAHGPAFAELSTPLPDEPPVTFQPAGLRLWVLLPARLARDDPVVLPPGASWNDALTAGLADGVSVLRGQLGDDPQRWRWGALHHFAARHPLGDAALDPPAVEVGGEWDTVMSTRPAIGVGFDAVWGSVARYVFDLNDWDESRWVVPLGASGDPTSPHFVDQQAAWAAGELFPMRYSWDDITATAESTTTLTP